MAQGESPLLELDRVVFAYQGALGEARLVFDNASLMLRPGERLGLHAPNGAGKSTLFRLLTGLETPISGRVLFHGKPLRTDRDWLSLRRRVGLVFQHAEDQLFCPTVLEDVAFGPLNLGLSPAEARRAAEETLRNLGLEAFAARPTYRLSGGEKRLVALASVLSMRPEALLLDEPTTGLDALSRKNVLDLLGELPVGGIFVSHDWDFLSALCTSFITILGKRVTEIKKNTEHTHHHAHPFGSFVHSHGR